MGISIIARSYKNDCLKYMRKLKAKGYKIYSTQDGTCDPTGMTINISPTHPDPLLLLETYWKKYEDNYKQESFKLAFSEFEKEK